MLGFGVAQRGGGGRRRFGAAKEKKGRRRGQSVSFFLSFRSSKGVSCAPARSHQHLPPLPAYWAGHSFAAYLLIDATSSPSRGVTGAAADAGDASAGEGEDVICVGGEAERACVLVCAGLGLTSSLRVVCGNGDVEPRGDEGGASMVECKQTGAESVTRKTGDAHAPSRTRGHSTHPHPPTHAAPYPACLHRQRSAANHQSACVRP